MSAVPVPDDLEPVIRENQRERAEHEIEIACTENGHAWLGAVSGDNIHGVCGHCPCGSKLYAIDGTELP